jgi:hypothetical protein
MKNLIAPLSLTIALLISGCASLSVNMAPNTNLDSLETFYVQKLPADERGIERLISDQLNLFGLKSTWGTSETPPEPVDAIVTYQDKWM